ncbi:MAG: peroxiredoxin family protein [Paramuribaculum sp.]|nr:peroxiredoxin family protein [Paramuribaculum sp.]
MRNIHYFIMTVATALAVISCSSNAEWKLKGKISDTSSDTPTCVVLEGQNKLGGWFVIDTLQLSSDGSFTANGAAPAYPEIYRLTYDGKSIYFPIDSIDNLHLQASAKDFDRTYQLNGSESAMQMVLVDSLINAFVGENGVSALDTAVTFKRRLADIVLTNPSGIVAYYIANKTVQGTPLLSINDKRDLRIIGAVANAFKENRPNDPRCNMMSDRYLSNMKRLSTNRDTIAAPEIGLIDIELPNADGTKVKLSDIADKNKVVVLNFTSYTQDFSTPLNIELRKLYDRYHSSGLEIYQIGVDKAAQSDNFEWRQAARNLPWVTVYNGPVAEYVTSYNVPTVPAIFIISGSTIVNRPANVEELTRKLGQLLGQ